MNKNYENLIDVSKYINVYETENYSGTYVDTIVNSIQKSTDATVTNSLDKATEITAEKVIVDYEIKPVRKKLTLSMELYEDNKEDVDRILDNAKSVQDSTIGLTQLLDVISGLKASNGDIATAYNKVYDYVSGCNSQNKATIVLTSSVARQLIKYDKVDGYKLFSDDGKKYLDADVLVVDDYGRYATKGYAYVGVLNKQFIQVKKETDVLSKVDDNNYTYVTYITYNGGVYDMGTGIGYELIGISE